MANSDYYSLLSGTGKPNRAGLLQAFEERGIYVVKSAENPTLLTPGFITALLFNGVVFWYDSADSTTAHDGVTCIVTADGKRFKTDNFKGANAKIIPVIDKDLTAPPGSPAIGDAYIVAAGGTGAWAGKDKYFASWTARNWVFIVPNAFDIAFVKDETLFYYYSAGGVWTSGLPGLIIADNSISVAKLKYNKFGLSIINQTTNTPPGSPADGDAYIIGGVPTGAWTGNALKVAIWETAAWVIYTPYEGAQVHDNSLDSFYRFTGTVWETSVSGYSKGASSALGGGATITQAYNYSATPPTTSNMDLLHTLNYTPKRAGATVEITVEVGGLAISITNTATANQVNHCKTAFGLFIDATVNAQGWSGGPDACLTTVSTAVVLPSENSFSHTFEWVAPDTSAHTLKLYGSKVFAQLGGPNGSATVVASDCKIIAKERA